MDPRQNDASPSRSVSLNATVHARLAAQEGLISGQQLLLAGLSARMVNRRIKARTLVRRSEPAKPRPQISPRTGRSVERRLSPLDVFGTHGAPLGPDARRWLALLSTPEPHWLTSVTVFALLGLERPSWEAIHVLHRGGGWNAPKGVIAHRSTSLKSHDTTMYGRFPGTTLSRALVDAAGKRGRLRIPDSRLDDVVDTAVGRGLYDGTAMVRTLADRPNVPGALRMTEVVGRIDATSGTFRSTFERRTKRLIERSTLIPQPVVNVLIDGFESDLFFPRTRAIIECDGRDYHRSPAQIAKDEQREIILRARGYVFLRLRWHHVVYEEETTLRRIERFVLANLDPPRPLSVV